MNPSTNNLIYFMKSDKIIFKNNLIENAFTNMQYDLRDKAKIKHSHPSYHIYPLDKIIKNKNLICKKAFR